MFIWLLGNISDGYTAYGPYDTFDECCYEHDGDDGWIMQLSPVYKKEEE
jgi:hypothetical protein